MIELLWNLLTLCGVVIVSGLLILLISIVLVMIRSTVRYFKKNGDSK